MTIEQLHRNIARGMYTDATHIWYENGEYSTSTEILYPLPERVWVSTVGDYRLKHGL